MDAQRKVTHFVSVQRDVTQEVNLERQLRQSQKMEALGTLAGGIAHDFNNILAAIIGYADMMLDEITAGGPAYQSLQQIKNSGKRAKDLVRQILAFTRQADQKKQPIKVKLIVDEALNMLRASLPATIDIHQNLASSGAQRAQCRMKTSVEVFNRSGCHGNDDGQAEYGLANGNTG